MKNESLRKRSLSETNLEEPCSFGFKHDMVGCAALKKPLFYPKSAQNTKDKLERNWVLIQAETLREAIKKNLQNFGHCPKLPP